MWEIWGVRVWQLTSSSHTRYPLPQPSSLFLGPPHSWHNPLPPNNIPRNPHACTKVLSNGDPPPAPLLISSSDLRQPGTEPQAHHLHHTNTTHILFCFLQIGSLFNGFKREKREKATLNKALLCKRKEPYNIVLRLFKSTFIIPLNACIWLHTSTQTHITFTIIMKMC